MSKRFEGRTAIVTGASRGIGLYEGREDAVTAAYRLKRLGVPGDNGGVVAFLLSDDAGWLTGQTVVVDGGVSLQAAEE